MPEPEKPRYGKRKLIAKVLGSGFLALVLACAALAALWEYGNLQPWLKARIVELYIRKLQPHIPFTIESVDVDTGWRNLLHGKVNQIEATLRWGKWRIPLAGPIEISRTGDKQEDYLIRFSPEASIEPAGSLLTHLGSGLSVGSKRFAGHHQHHHGEGSSTSIQLDMEIEVNRDLTHLKSMRLDVMPSDEGPEFRWPLMGLEVKGPRITAHWDGSRAQVDAAASGAHWQGSGNEVIAGKLSVQAETPLTLKPFSLGPVVQLAWKGDDAEALLGETYLAPPVSRVPGHGKITLSADPSSRFAPERLDLALGPEGASQLHLSARLSRGTGGKLDRVTASWKLDPLDLPSLREALLKAAGATGGPLQNAKLLRDLAIRSGTVSAEGSASVPWPPSRFRVDRPQDSIDARLKLKNVAARLDPAAVAARGIEVDLPVSTQKPEKGSVSIRDLFYRGFRAHLGLTDVELGLRKDARGAKTTHFDFSLGNGQRIPLTVDGIVLELQRVWGILGLADDDEKGFHYELETGLSLLPTPAQSFAGPLCLTQRIPPAIVSASFPKIDLAPGTIDPTGEARISVFDGTIVASGIGLFKIGSRVPELDFNLDAKSLSLGRMADWFDFGDMDGVLDAYAHDVTVQGWLPTHYDFRTEVKPLHKRMVDWSPEAFQNFLHVFMNAGLDHLPGIAQWAAFGWPAHLLGGYDLWSAGISLFADQGSILMETVEPKDVYEHFRKHFILAGQRIKMPLNAEQYPVVLDATAVANYVHGMVERLGGIKKKKKKEISHENSSAACLPPAF